LADLNNDDLLDIICGNWEGNHRIFLQLKPKSGRHFRNVTSAFFEQPSSILTVLLADFDNDMQTDIFMNNILRQNDPQYNSAFGVNILTDANITIVERDCGEAIEKNGYGTGAAYMNGESSEHPLTVYSAKKNKK